ncbi:hypothetical protein [Streptomyces sp. NPDC047108]|uniref:hypothetical protein n=1 Tax=Streptomyces sp. NPDC047108 TaxID=3155025 RepID=UPI0033DF6128
MGWEEVADQLYALPPEQFTAARDKAAKAAPRGDAAKIRGLRRPTLAAWAVNLLVRSDRDQITALLGLGEQLRRAHQDLDGSQLRELSGQQRKLVTALSQQTQRLATEAGRPVGESVLREVEATVQAALADADAAEELATGRMTKALTPRAGFGPPVSATVHRLRPRESGSGSRGGGRRGKGSSVAPGRTASVTHLAERAEEQERAERERREALETARDLEAEMERAAHASARKSADSQDELADAETRRRQAEERVRELEAELKAARAELTEARRDERNARVPARRARDEAERDRKRAEDASADVDRLEAEEPRSGRTRR